MRVGLFLSVALCHGLAAGQSWEVFDMQNTGFPSNTVKSIAADSAGYVWVGTDWGLCRYDGSTWTILQAGNSDLPENDIRALAVDTLGRLWIGTQLHGVVVYDGVNWTTYDTQNSPMPDDEVNCITFDHRGWAWIGTVGGLACYTGSQWRVYNDGPNSYGGLQLNGNHIKDVAVGADGLVSIGTLNGGFHYLTDTLVQVHATYIDMFPDNTALGVIMDDANNERWLACPAGGLLRQGGSWMGGPWLQYTTFNSNIPSNALIEAFMDESGQLWFGSQLNGFFLRNGNGTYLHYNTNNSPLPDNTVQVIAQAQDGALWLGTFLGGAVRVEGANGSEDRSRTDRMPLRVYPNPFTDQLFVDLAQHQGSVNWEMVDLMGRTIMTGNSTGGGVAELSIEPLVPGAYMLRIMGQRPSEAVRVVKY